jgi:hypothetical protein
MSPWSAMVTIIDLFHQRAVSKTTLSRQIDPKNEKYQPRFFDWDSSLVIAAGARSEGGLNADPDKKRRDFVPLRKSGTQLERV